MSRLLQCATVVLVLATSASAERHEGSIYPLGAPAITSPTSDERTGQVTAVNVTGTPSITSLGGANAQIPVFIGVGARLNGIGWDVFLTGFSPSWISEMAVNVSGSAIPGGGFFLRPGAAQNFPGGPTRFASGGVVKLASVMIPDVPADAAGFVYLHFYDGIDDPSVNPDGVWGGTTFPRFPTESPEGLTLGELDSYLYLQAVPAPAGVGLLVASGVMLVGRKRLA